MIGRLLRFTVILSVGVLMFEGLTFGAVVLAFLAWFFSEPFWELLKVGWTEFWRRRMFKARFVNKLPPGEMELSRWGPHLIPFGSSEHYLRVRSTEALKISRFNVRFVDLEELSSDPGTIIDIQHIVSISALSMAPRNIAHGIKITARADEKGGRDVRLEPPMEVAVGEPFVLQLLVKAHGQLWKGKISFRGHDGDGNRRFGREDVEAGVA